MIMIRKRNSNSLAVKKKTRQGSGKHSKFSHSGGGPNGSTISKKYRKKYRGQGR